MNRRVVYVHVAIFDCKQVTCLAPSVIQRCQERVCKMYEDNTILNNCSILVRVSVLGKSGETRGIECKNKTITLDFSESVSLEIQDGNEIDERMLKRM